MSHPLRRIWVTNQMAIELSEYNMDFIPAIAIKRAYFIAKLTQVDTSATWIIEVDGSSCNVKVGISIHIITKD